jgi:carbonic anhydrase
MLRTFSIATHLLQVKRIMIVIHTDCAMASDDIQMRERIAAVNPDIELGNLSTQTTARPYETIHADAMLLADSGLMAPGVVIGTFEYDVHTGALRVLEKSVQAHEDLA